MPKSLFGLFIFLDLFVWEREKTSSGGAEGETEYDAASALSTSQRQGSILPTTLRSMTWAESRVGGLTNCAKQVPQFGLFCLIERNIIHLNYKTSNYDYKARNEAYTAQVSQKFLFKGDTHFFKDKLRII